MGKLSDTMPQKNEVVKIKFKNFNEIMAFEKRNFHDADDVYEFGENFNAYMQGGHFVVTGKYEYDKDDKTGEVEYESISVSNHLDCRHSFRIYEECIESIEVIQDAERFSSRDHKVLVVRVEDELYINGVPLIWNEEQQKKEHESNRRFDENKPYENPNRKLIKIFENYIADLAVRESFRDMGE